VQLLQQRNVYTGHPLRSRLTGHQEQILVVSLPFSGTTVIRNKTVPFPTLTKMELQMATKEMCIYCFDSLIAHFEKTTIPPPTEFENGKFPLFVSWHKFGRSSKTPALRGCKGTFSALKIHDGLQEFALISAFKDNRFSPVEEHEVPRLECSVNLLHSFIECKDCWDWEIGVHGIVIDFVDPKRGKNRNATYLPCVAPEQGWDQAETLRSLIQKAGYDGTVTDELLKSLKVTRYQSSETSLRYDEYVIHKKQTSI